MKLIIKILVFPIAMIPYRMQWLISRLFAIFMYRVLKFKRVLMRANLSIAFPEKSLQERDEIAISSMQNVIMYFFDFCNLFHTPAEKFPDSMPARFEYDGLPLILMCSHLGSGPIFGLSSARACFPSKNIVVITKQTFLIKLFASTLGIQVIASDANNVVVSVVRELKRGSVLVFTMDVYAREEKVAVDVEFFGRETRFYGTLANIANMVGCDVRQAYHIRTEKKCGTSTMGGVLPKEADPIKATKYYVSLLEDIIRKYPEQWWWSYTIYRDKEINSLIEKERKFWRY